jgi:hypothetical protein
LVDENQISKLVYIRRLKHPNYKNIRNWEKILKGCTIKNKTKKSKIKEKLIHQEVVNVQDDLFDRCMRKGLIEKTPFGYYFAPEFFEILDNDLKKNVQPVRKNYL